MIETYYVEEVEELRRSIAQGADPTLILPTRVVVEQALVAEPTEPPKGLSPEESRGSAAPAADSDEAMRAARMAEARAGGQVEP